MGSTVDTFPGSSLDAAWSRRNVTTGDETFLSPGLRVNAFAAGDVYYRNAPAGDFSIELEFTAKSAGAIMMGPVIIDNSGNGVMGSTYTAPTGTLVLSMSAYSYGSTFQNAGGSMSTAGRVRLTKSGSNYTVAYSTNGGSSWSSESPNLAPSFTPTRVGFAGMAYGGDGTITAVEFKINEPNATVAAVAATATATCLAPVVTAVSTVAAVAAASTASALTPSVTGTGDGTVLGVAASAAAAPLAPSVTTGATVGGVAATATASALVPAFANDLTVTATTATATAGAVAPFISNDSPDVTIAPPPATATAAARAPVWTGVKYVSTDTSNAFGGLSLVGLAQVSFNPPIAAPPAALSTTRVDKAIALPAPVLVKGRPT